MGDTMAEKTRKERAEELEMQRKRFGAMVQAFERDFGANSYLNRAPVPREDALEGAEILADRHKLLDRMPKSAVCAEIGIDRGYFSLAILEQTIPQELFLVDITLSRLDPASEAQLRARPEVTLIEAPSETGLASHPDASFDWIYLDADHSYGAVKKDIDALINKVKPGGYFLFNDFTLWSPANMMNYGVSRAAFEFLNANPDWTVAYLALQGGGYHDLALRRLR